MIRAEPVTAAAAGGTLLPAAAARGLWCVGSSAGLMAILFALGAMSVLWMGVVTALVLVLKLLPPRSTNPTEGAR